MGAPTRPQPAPLWYRFKAMKTALISKKAIQVLCFWVVFAVSTTAHAAFVENLYTGEAPLPDQRDGPGARASAQLAALDQVLFRLTGDVDARSALTIDADNVSGLIQSQQMIEREWLNRQEVASSQLRLRVEFDAIALDQRLAEAGLRRWGRERVSVLAWAVIEQAFSVRLLEDPMLERALQQWARVYGLDLVRPLGDALDLAQLELTDIRGGFLDQAVPGLERYGAGVALMLDLRAVGSGWLARAFWRIDGIDGGQTFQGPTRVAVLAQALEGLLQALIQRYAIDLNDTSTQTKTLRLLGMDDPVQYAEALQYLNGLSVVDDLRLIEAANNEMVFEVVVRGDNLIDLLAVGQTLEVTGTAPTGLIDVRLQ